jgi:hypothetical protein
MNKLAISLLLLVSIAQGIADGESLRNSGGEHVIISVEDGTTNIKWIKLTTDGYTCQFSGQYGGSLEVHHIKPFYQIVEDNNLVTSEQALECKELWDVANGITLAQEYHSIKSTNPLAFHAIYGNKNFTQEDFRDWYMML